MVVMVTVTIMIQAKSTGLSVPSPDMVCSATETTNPEIIADTSLHALMRHQYQRSSSTPPVPAPVTISSFHAPEMEPMKNVTIPEIIVNTTLAPCDSTR